MIKFIVVVSQSCSNFPCIQAIPNCIKYFSFEQNRANRLQITATYASSVFLLPLGVLNVVEPPR